MVEAGQHLREGRLGTGTKCGTLFIVARERNGVTQERVEEQSSLGGSQLSDCIAQERIALVA